MFNSRHRNFFCCNDHFSLGSHFYQGENIHVGVFINGGTPSHHPCSWNRPFKTSPFWYPHDYGNSQVFSRKSHPFLSDHPHQKSSQPGFGSVLHVLRGHWERRCIVRFRRLRGVPKELEGLVRETIILEIDRTSGYEYDTTYCIM